MSPHPSLDDAQSLFESWVFGGVVGIVGLPVECCDVIYHLQTETQHRCDTAPQSAIM